MSWKLRCSPLMLPFKTPPKQMAHVQKGCHCCRFFEAYQAKNVFSSEFKRTQAQKSRCHGPAHPSRGSHFSVHETSILVLYLLMESALTHNNLLSAHISD